MTLGQRIQELRRQKGLSQESLGEALGVTRQAVSKWEGDNGIPELDTLIAMSRLFGVTVGALLGLEEPARPAAEPAEANEEEPFEAILRRYREETKAETAEPPPKPRREWPAALAAAALAAVAVVLFVQMGSLRRTVRQLRSQMSSLEAQVSNDLGSLPEQIRSGIYAVLEEQSDLLNTFDWQPVAFDEGEGLVTLGLRATMKTYSPGSQAQFRASWTKTDESGGETVSDWAEGPDFALEMTLPMSYRAEISIRVKDAGGTVREQPVDTIYALHPDRFQLEGYNLLKPFAVTVISGGVARTTAKAEEAHVDILSEYPQLFWPETAVLTARLNGEELFSQSLTVTPAGEAGGRFGAALEGGCYDLTLAEGDILEAVLAVTDNLGRTREFTEGGVVEDGWLEYSPMAPADGGYGEG